VYTNYYTVVKIFNSELTLTDRQTDRQTDLIITQLYTQPLLTMLLPSIQRCFYWHERNYKDSAGFVDSKENESVLNKAGIKRELLDTVQARKLAYCGHTMRKRGSCLQKEIMQGTMPGA